MFKLFFLLTTIAISHSSFAVDTNKEERQILSQAMNDTRESIASSLASDPQLEKNFKKYAQKAQEILARTDLQRNEKHQAIADLNLAQRKNLDLLLLKAKVDRKLLNAKMGDVFKRMQAKYKKEYKWFIDEGMGVHWRSAQALPSAEPTPASPITHILSAPFNERDTSAVGEESRVDLEEGKYQAFSTGIMLMSTTRENGIGHFFSPLATHNRIKVTASVFNVDVDLFAMGFAGVSSAGAKSILKIKKSGRTICETEYDHGSVLAVAAWISDDEHGDQFSIDCTIRSTDNENELNVTLTGKVSTMTAGGGASSAAVNTKVREIKIKHFNN